VLDTRRQDIREHERQINAGDDKVTEQYDDLGVPVVSCARSNGRQRAAATASRDCTRVQHPPTMGLVRSSRGVDVATNQRYYLVLIRVRDLSPL
jgi:hypothetical protein